MVSSNETNNRVKGRNGEETGVCVHMCVCSFTWVVVWYWGHRVSGVCYGAKMDITEKEGASVPMPRNSGWRLTCLLTWQTGMLLASWTTTWAKTNKVEYLDLRNVYKDPIRTLTSMLQSILVYFYVFLFLMENEYTTNIIKMWHETFLEF